jgi:transposase InsO family protein
MSRKGNCWDNAVMERFFRSLKTERLNYQSFANHYETRTTQLLVLKPNQGRWLNSRPLKTTPNKPKPPIFPTI